MIEYVIRRAIIWAITIAVVAGVTAAVTNATRKSLSKSLEHKLTELGIDPNNPDEELMGQLIDVNVSKRGSYVVSVEENVYGKFSVVYLARNKNDAIEKLGKKVFGFVNVNKKTLSNEEKDFFMRIWFETFAKSKISKNKESYEADCNILWYDVDAFKNDIKSIEKKLVSYNRKNSKLEFKNKISSARKVSLKINDLTIKLQDKKNELNELEKKLDTLKEKIIMARDCIKNPEFTYSNKIGLSNYPLVAKINAS